jgi:hypothetical protein
LESHSLKWNIPVSSVAPFAKCRPSLRSKVQIDKNIFILKNMRIWKPLSFLDKAVREKYYSRCAQQRIVKHYSSETPNIGYIYMFPIIAAIFIYIYIIYICHSCIWKFKQTPFHIQSILKFLLAHLRWWSQESSSHLIMQMFSSLRDFFLRTKLKVCTSRKVKT